MLFYCLSEERDTFVEGHSLAVDACRPADEDRGAHVAHEAGAFAAYRPVDRNFRFGVAVFVEEAACGSDLVEDAVDELRSGETGLDEHQDHPFDLVEIGRQRLDRRGGIHHQSEMRSARPDGFRQLVQLFPSSTCSEIRSPGRMSIASMIGKGVFDHQVDVERQLRYAVHRRDEIDAERGRVGNEMGVHHIHVEVIHAVAFQLLDVALQIHQIGAHDRNRYSSFFGGVSRCIYYACRLIFFSRSALNFAAASVAVALGVPDRGDRQHADDGEGEDHDVGAAPAVVVGHVAESHARDQRAGVTEDTQDAVGAGRRLLGGLVGRRDAQQCLRAVDEEGDQREGNGQYPCRGRVDTEDRRGDDGAEHTEHAGAVGAAAEDMVRGPACDDHAQIAAHELEDGYHDARHGDRYALRTGQEHHAPVEHREADDVRLKKLVTASTQMIGLPNTHAAQERLVVGGVRRGLPSSPRRPAVRPAFPARAVRPTTACRAA